MRSSLCLMKQGSGSDENFRNIGEALKMARGSDFDNGMRGRLSARPTLEAAILAVAKTAGVPP